MTDFKVQPDDARWQAFLYVHGELSADDADAFEQQMLHDTELCEKVAEASLLSSAVVECRDEPAIVHIRPPVRSTGLRSLAVIVTGCCCAALMMFVVDPSDTDPAVDAGTTDGTEASVLLAAWIDNADNDDELYDQETDSSFEPDLEIPEWMLAGIVESDSNRGHSDGRQQDNDSPHVL